MKTTKRNTTLMTLAAALLLAAPAVQAVDNTGEGGTITYTDADGAIVGAPVVGGDVIHTFTNSGTLNIPVAASAEVLVVAGGGQGGLFAGGGGAGGLIYSNAFAVSAGATTVTVGNGGSGVTTDDQGASGANSVLPGASTTLTATGGGGGGSRGGTRNGASGGSGGGGSGADDGSPGLGGAGASGQGNSGGKGADWGAGGGGGAGAAGSDADGDTAGKGGDGLAYSISGSNTYYAGGGGGGTFGGNTVGAGGLGGGASGADDNQAGIAATPNTGGGGGGGSLATGGSGGSGIVIVRYLYEEVSTFSIALASPANGQIFDYTTSVPATAAFFNGTAPYTVEFYLDSTLVSTTTNATSPLTVDLAVLPGEHTVYATVTDNTSTVVTSGTRSFPVAPASTANDITAFNANLAGSRATITTESATNGTVLVVVPFGTTEAQVAALAPSYTLSPFATCPRPSPDTTGDFNLTTPVHYIVTAQSGAQKNYTVTVIVSLWTYSAWTGDADSGITSASPYTVAVNCNGAAVSVNGVAFQASALSGANFLIEGDVAVWGPDGAPNVTGDSLTLANCFIYNGNPRTVTLTNLTPGATYETSLFAFGFEPARIQTFASGSDSLVLDQNLYGQDNGIRIAYTFVADSSGSKVFTITPVVANTFHMSALANRQVSAVGGSYTTWATANGIPGEPATGDFDNDGLTNLMEYALGKSPTVSSQPAGELSGKVITFTKGAAAIANGDVSWVIQTSTTLAADSWTDVVTQAAGNTDTTISYTLPDGVLGGKVFARLVVTQTP